MSRSIVRAAAFFVLTLSWGCGDDTNAGGNGGSGGEGGQPMGGTGAAGGVEGGAGGVGGEFMTASHPDAPQVITYGGPVLATPKVKTILYADDPMTAPMEEFLAKMNGSTSTYWSTVTSEYGIGPLSVSPSIHRPEAPPTGLLDESQLLADLDTNTSGANPPWGEADPDTIYLFVLPADAVVDDGTGSICCDDGYDGYHFEVDLQAATVPYSVICQCPGLDGPGIDEIGQLTIVASHELVEAATDPFPGSDPGYVDTDDANFAWTVVTGGEVSDMCDYNNDAYVTPADLGFLVTRSWSNASAAAGENPCLPFAATTPYFNSPPVLTDDVTLYGYATKGMTIAVGETKSVELDLFSTLRTSGPWDILALDVSEFFGGPKLLDLTLAPMSGENGDKLELQIHVLADDPNAGAELFILYSALDGQDNLEIGTVGN